MVMLKHIRSFTWDFPLVQVKNLPATAGDMSWIPGPGRSHMLQDN